tara:strand:- start:930 stop:1112 length:183 start_codon:yes stop_codon:yes gene_type:complete
LTLNSSAQDLAFSKLKDAIDVTSTPSICLNAGKYAAFAKLAPTIPIFSSFYSISFNLGSK